MAGPKWIVCEQKDRHLPHEWFTERDEFRRCPGVFDRPTLDAACARLAAFVHGHDEGHPAYYYNAHRSDLVALLAAVGWGVTVDEARIDEPAPEQETLL